MNPFRLFLILTLALIASALVVGEVRSATSGGGSSIAAARAYKAGPFVIGTGTVTKVGRRYGASFRISLYRVPPGGMAGQIMASQSGQVPTGSQQVNVTTRAGCLSTRARVRWFTVLKVNSRPRPGSALVVLKVTSPLSTLHCQ